ncbi:MAG: M56 family metallopeptidase [Tannerellaceae bacterium]|nr:M56 family metallopeptidase [Tannerellaceae bacterium]
MSPELIYFIKINAALVIFYAFYRLFFYKDTFFNLRRFILVGFFALALGYPVLNLQEWVTQQEPIAEVIQMYSAILPEITVQSEATASTSWTGIFSLIAISVYGAGIVMLFIRFFIQLGSIVWIKTSSRVSYINGIKVYHLKEPAGPFSFFQWIFLHPETHSPDEQDEILTHELTHARQWHSIDVMISELICIICWINPFVWLLKREVRHNLEYLADNNVLKLGYDSRNYQYHLLGLAHQQSASALYNNFNVLHLKNRIRMMNKERSHSLSRTKYLLFIPLTAVLMLISNIEAVARVTIQLAESMQNLLSRNQAVTKENYLVEQETDELIITAHHAPAPVPSPVEEAIQLPAETEMINAQQAPISTEISTETVEEQTEEADYDAVFTVVEEMPSFPGGDQELLRYINRNVRYPEIAQENGLQGRVVVTFVVNKDGTVSNPEVVRGIDPSLNMEALRIVMSMPEWTPGRQRGYNVAVKYTLPIVFRLA